MKIRAILVDDEPLALWELQRLLLAHHEIEIIGEAKNGHEALRLIREQTPDLVFLDIEMPGMTGFDLLAEICGDLPDVIFTTAYDQHAVRAFEVNALDYLLKPIAPERLAATVGRLRTRREATPVSRIFVRDTERCWIVSTSEIRLLESEGNYTRLYFGQDRPLIRRTLNSLEQQLAAHSFYRANRRQIVNLSCIKSTHLGADGRVSITITGGHAVELSRRRADELRHRLEL